MTSQRARRIAEGTAAVGLWMAIGFVFQPSKNAYLLLGIPITVCFERYVRREPLRAMWVRSAPPFRIGARGAGLAILIGIFPLIDFVNSIRSHAAVSTVASMLIAIAGAWAAAYALTNFRRRTFRELLICLATTGTVGCAIQVAFALLRGLDNTPVWSRVNTGVASFLDYVPATLLLEEVWFRGVLDAHLHHPGESRGLLSAIYVSLLWGLWHCPLSKFPDDPAAKAETFVMLLLVHVCMGTLLSRAWRRSGNLLVPGIAHSLIDAVRNAIA